VRHMPGPDPALHPDPRKDSSDIPSFARVMVTDGRQVSHPEATFAERSPYGSLPGDPTSASTIPLESGPLWNGGAMLSHTQVDQYRMDGFLRLPSLLEPEDVQEVRALLDPLFERFDALPRANTRDLGADGPEGGFRVRSAEVNRAITLCPGLRHTGAYLKCRAVARVLGGHPMGYSFDHAIYKAPFNERETPWHQDHAYSGHCLVLETFHFWIPLQEATVANGCMQFVPGSHREGLRTHIVRSNGHVREVELRDAETPLPCPLPVGGMTIHSPLTLHYTGPNASPDTRRAWIIHFGAWGRAAKLHPSILREKLRFYLGRGVGPL